MNQPYVTLTCAPALHKVFGVQLYKNSAHALLSHILSIVNSDWLQHALGVSGVYESIMTFLTSMHHLTCIYCDLSLIVKMPGMSVFRFLPEFSLFVCLFLVQIYAFLFIFSPFLAVLVQIYMLFQVFSPSVSGFLSGTDWHPWMLEK